MAAPVLAVLFRLLQGFALGGEVGPNAAFLLEAAPPQARAASSSRCTPRPPDLGVLAAGLDRPCAVDLAEPRPSSTPGAGGSPS